jgi:hypothetical protein
MEYITCECINCAGNQAVAPSRTTYPTLQFEQEKYKLIASVRKVASLRTKPHQTTTLRSEILFRALAHVSTKQSHWPPHQTAPQTAIRLNNFTTELIALGYKLSHQTAPQTAILQILTTKKTPVCFTMRVLVAAQSRAADHTLESQSTLRFLHQAR